jgi:uncharacterized protein
MSQIENIVEKIKKLGGDKVKFIILYGSLSTNKQTPLSDVDLAVFYNGSKEERFRFRMKILGRVPDKYDIQIFQDLPLHVKNEIIKGKVLYKSDNQLIYQIARETYQAFDDFKKRFYDYIKGDVIT